MTQRYFPTMPSDKKLTEEKYLKTFILDYMQMKDFIKKPLIISEADGIRYKDINGRIILDAVSGIFAVNVGHQNQRVIEAMKSFLDSFVFSPPLHGTNPQVIKLAYLLSEIAPGNLTRVKFFSSGSEANEAAMKMARQYHKLKGNHRKYKFLSLYGGYQGATMGAMSAGGTAAYKKYFEPLGAGFIHFHPPYCYRCPYGQKYPGCNLTCAKTIERTIENEDPDSIAGMILEPIINVSGAITPPVDYLPMIREICSHHNIILIFDEIITGFGRTGELFAANTFDVVPDILCCGKGMSSGYAPLAACLFHKNIYDTFWGAPEIKFLHGHTYGGHALSATTGIYAIKELLENDLPGNARRLEGYVKDKLKDLDNRIRIIGDIRGKGLLVCAELVSNKETKERFSDDIKLGKQIAKICLENGLFLRSEAHWFSIAPPLIVTENEIDEIFTILEKSIDQVLKSI